MNEQTLIYDQERLADGLFNGKVKTIFHTFHRYKNDNLKTELFYKNGELEGECKSWYKNGNLKTEAFYKNGELEGDCKSWYKNGNLKKEEEVKSETGGKTEGYDVVF